MLNGFSDVKRRLVRNVRSHGRAIGGRSTPRPIRPPVAVYSAHMPIYCYYISYAAVACIYKAPYQMGRHRPDLLAGSAVDLPPLHTQPAIDNTMKTLVRVVVLTMLLPLLGLAQDAKKDGAKAPAKGTLSVFRIIPKPGHDEALKSALRAHAQKFHTGNWKWRVSAILTGPDAGGYQVSEGPNSWTDLEGRGDLGADHSKDFETTIMPHAERMTPEMYATYQETASTVNADAWSTKTVVTHYYVKPGCGPALLALLRALKAPAEKAGLNIAVWQTFNSGQMQLIVSRRLKNGFKDFDAGGMTIRASFDSVHGDGAFERGLAEMGRLCDRIEGEMIEHEPNLGSP
jgi:hypothetical protein